MADDDEQTTGLDEAIETLQEHDPDAVADALDSRAHSIYQTIYDDGHEAGLGEINRKYDKAQDRIGELESKLDSRSEEIENLREESPDTDELYSQWEEQELQPVQEELQDLRSRVRESSRKDAKRSVVDHIEDEVGDEFLAETVVERHADRISVDDNGETEFLRPNGTPYATRSDQDPAKLFAKDVVEQIPERYRTQNEQGGPRSTDGTDGQPSGNPSNNGMTRADLADPQKAAKFRQEFDSPEAFEEAVQQLPES